MSGIVGLTNLKHDTKERQHWIIHNMADKIRHRGIDGSLYLDQSIALENAQKLSDYIITFDGAIFNKKEVVQALQQLGYKFNDDSDAEIFLTAYIQWKEECLEHIDGIFAFAIWDAKNKKLFAARDRLGMKPFFFTVFDKDIAFCSEIKGLFALPNFKSEIDCDGLAEIMSLLPSRTEGFGIFKGIEELKAGYCLTWQDGEFVTRKYWDLVSKPHEDSISTTTEKIKELLKNAVLEQMSSGDDFATFVSGGLDSSCVTSFASSEYQNNKRILSTYSFDYVDNGKYFKSSLFQPNTDTDWATKVAAELNTNNKLLMADTDDLINNLERAVLARDLPGMADIDSSLLYFCSMVKGNGTNLVLSGECADEVFGGYPWFYSEKSFEEDGFPWVRGTADRLKLFNSDIIAYSKPEEYQNNKYFGALSNVPKLPGEDKKETRIRELFYICLHWFGASLIERQDRMSACSGLEIRAPFADYKLAQYVWNIPWSMKSLNGREKGILRLAMKGEISDAVLERKKSPYPKTHNPSYYAAVKKLLEETINDTSNKITPLINKEAIESFLKNDESDLPFFGQLMKNPQICGFLLQLNFWLKEYNVSIV